MSHKQMQIKQNMDYDAMEKFGPGKEATKAFIRQSYPTISVSEYIKKIRGVYNAAPD